MITIDPYYFPWSKFAPVGSGSRFIHLVPDLHLHRSAHNVKGNRSGVSVSSLGGPTIRMKRKDCKLVNLEDMINRPHQPEELYLSSSSWDDDPCLNYPGATTHLIEVFFTQSAHEVSMMFPRRAFTP
jgi:hypothetical protein